MLAKKCDFTADKVNEYPELLIASMFILLNKPKGYKIDEAVKLACLHEASTVYISQLHQLQGSPHSHNKLW